MPSNSCAIDWWALTIALLRMDTVTTLVESTIGAAIEQCQSFAELHTIQSNLACILTSEHVRRFPMRPSYVYSLLKLVVGRSESAARTIELSGVGEYEEEEDSSPVSEDLFEVYLEFATSGGCGSDSQTICKNEGATFYKALLAEPLCPPLTRDEQQTAGVASPSRPFGGDVAFLSCEAEMGRFVPMRVTSEFVNVGLAVWPAAHITVDLLATLVEMGGELQGDADRCRAVLAGWFPRAPKSMIDSMLLVTKSEPDSAVRVLELGAGVGLTPAVLHKRYAFASLPSSSSSPSHNRLPAVTIAVTDYQPNILDNCAFNLEINGCTYAQAKDSTELSSSFSLLAEKENKERKTLHQEEGGESKQRRESDIRALAVPLDWNEREQTRAVVRAVRPHLAIAADCIYDRCVLDGLSETLRDAMGERFLLKNSAEEEKKEVAAEAAASGRSTCNGCVSIIIQTHRNDATQTELHEKLRRFARVYSFHYDVEGHRLVPLDGDEDGWRAGARPAGDPSPERCLALKRCGEWRVEMSDIMYVHFLWMNDDSP